MVRAKDDCIKMHCITCNELKLACRMMRPDCMVAYSGLLIGKCINSMYRYCVMLKSTAAEIRGSSYHVVMDDLTDADLAFLL